ncbi:MAG TPA: HEAT repeat domain-containing protein [Thermomicrobiales bacterium]|nr:HEAT repeat domain-containing protein [Thermomicrobiales bacterium]
MPTPTFLEPLPNDDDAEDAAPLAARPPLADTLAGFASGPARPVDVANLSDLDRAEADAFAAAWRAFPEDTRAAIVRAMDELAEDRVELNFGRVLRLALDDPSPVVRQLAVAALWEDERADMLERLRRVLAADASEDVRAEAAKGLGRFAERAAEGGLDGGDQLRAELLAVAVDPAEPYSVRRRALEAAGAFGADERVRAAIDDFYDSGDQGFRGSALFAMGRSCDARWLNRLLDELEGDEAELRFEAAHACGVIGDPDAIPALLRLADDEDAEVRHAAIDAIGQIGGQAAVRALQAITANADEAAAAEIEEALAEANASIDPLGTEA